jgi:hypothetical protein
MVARDFQSLEHQHALSLDPSSPRLNQFPQKCSFIESLSTDPASKQSLDVDVVSLPELKHSP